MVDLKKRPFYLKEEDIKWVNDTIASMTDEEKVASQTAQLSQEEAHIGPLRQKFAHKHRDARGIVRGQSREYPVHHFLTGKAQHFAGHAGGERFVGRTAQRQHLTEQAHGIAHGTGGTAGDEMSGLLLEGTALAAEYVADMRFQRSLRYLSEHEMLTAAHDGDGELVLFRGGKDEGHTRRRFFQRLEEGVESRL